MRILNRQEALKNEFTLNRASNEEDKLISRNYLSSLYNSLLSFKSSIKGYDTLSSKVKFTINPECKDAKWVTHNGERLLKLTKTIFIGSIYPTEIEIFSDKYMLVNNKHLQILLNPDAYEVETSGRLVDDGTIQKSNSQLRRDYVSNFSEPQIYLNNYFCKWDMQLIDCDQDWFFSYNPADSEKYIDDLMHKNTGNRPSNKSKLVVESKQDKAKALLNSMSKADKEKLLKELLSEQ